MAKSKKSRSHDLFSKTADRARQMFDFSIALSNALIAQQKKDEGVKLAKEIEEGKNKKKLPTKAEYNSFPTVSGMGRASIVIAVSAMDEYFTHRYSRCVVPLMKQDKPAKK